MAIFILMDEYYVDLSACQDPGAVSAAVAALRHDEKATEEIAARDMGR
jgi:hypothetical protein